VRKLHIGIIDLVSHAAKPGLWARVMNANFASIMPQVVGGWCESQGHDVTLICYTGFEDLLDELPRELDLVFIGAFTQAAQLSYALSNLLQSRGAITVLGGPHARCYPQDAQRYFDYVLGFTDESVIPARLLAASAFRDVRLGRFTAGIAARSPRTLEVYRADPPQGAFDQDRPDDRQPGMPIYVQLLHRCRRAVPATEFRRDEGRPPVPPDEVSPAARWMA